MNSDLEDHYRPDPYANDELVPFDVQDYANKRGKRMVVIAGILIIAVLFLIFKLYSSGVRDRGETPVVQAENTPYKVVPDDPGGLEEPNQDLQIYDAMNGSSNDPSAKIEESAEVPIRRPDTVNIEVRDRPTDVASSETNKTIPVTQTEVKRPVSSSADSRYVVQLASLKSQSAAAETQAKIESRLSNLFPSGSYMEIVRADLGDKGVFYRLRLAGLKDKATASSICEKLKARQQTCFTTTK